MRAAWEMRAPVTDALPPKLQNVSTSFHYLSRAIPIPDTSSPHLSPSYLYNNFSLPAPSSLPLDLPNQTSSNQLRSRC